MKTIFNLIKIANSKIQINKFVRQLISVLGKIDPNITVNVYGGHWKIDLKNMTVPIVPNSQSMAARSKVITFSSSPSYPSPAIQSTLKAIHQLNPQVFSYCVLSPCSPVFCNKKCEKQKLAKRSLTKTPEQQIEHSVLNKINIQFNKLNTELQSVKDVSSLYKMLQKQFELTSQLNSYSQNVHNQQEFYKIMDLHQKLSNMQKTIQQKLGHS